MQSAAEGEDLCGIYKAESLVCLIMVMGNLSSLHTGPLSYSVK